MSSKIEQFILNDEVGNALLLTNSFLRKSQNESGAALYILQVLSAALAKSMRLGYQCISDFKDIFKLADICCKAFKKTWMGNHTSFMQYIYQVCKYLILEGDACDAIKLGSYVFELKNHNNTSWNEDQKCVLNSLLKDCSDAWFTQKKIDLSDKKSQSVSAQWTFLYNLSELNGFQNISLTFHALSKILSNVSDPTDGHRFASKAFIQFSNALKSNENDCILKILQNTTSFYSMINCYFKMMSQDNFIRLNHSHLVSFLNLLSNHLEFCDNTVKAVASLITLIRDIRSKNVNSYIKDIESGINVLRCTKELNSVTVKIVYALVRLISNQKDEPNLGEMFLKMGNLFAMVFKENMKDVGRSEQVDLFISHSIVKVTMTTVNKWNGDQEKLKAQFPNVIKIIEFFFRSQNLTDDKSLTYLSSAVYFFSTVAETYKSADLVDLSGRLGKYLIFLLRELKFSSDVPSSLKQNIEVILSYFVKGSVSYALSFECLMWLLALTEETNPLFNFSNKFKFWTQLKLCALKDVGCVTSYEVINSERSAMDQTIVVDIMKWPFSVLPQLDYTRSLLLEIQSYLKHKELMKPVLAVYKDAVSHVKCKITLSRILCCASKFILENAVEMAVIVKFQSSLKNMIKIISNSNEEFNQVDKMLVLGDLNYMLARSEIFTLRKDAQAKVVNTYNQKVLPGNIPVIDDPLNCTVIVNEFSFISYTTQEKVMLLLSQAVSFWNQALTSLLKCNGDQLKKLEFSVNCSLKFIKETGYLYHLYKNVKQEASVWQLLFDICNHFNFPKYKIIAFSELICLLIRVNPELIDEMKSYVKSQPNIERTYYYHLFQIALGKNLLYNKKFVESMEVLNELNKCYLNSNLTLYVQYGLYSYYLRSGIEMPDSKRTRELIQLFESCLFQSKATSRSFVQETVDYCLLFDLALILGRQFSKVHDPRYARLYSSKQWELSQELHVPMRACELLIVQAEIDNLCVDLKSVTNKIFGVETILELSHKGVQYSLHPDLCTCTTCGHVEYQIAFAYLILLKTGLKKAEHASTECLELLKDCREVLSRVKKKLNQNYITDFLDCDISFSLTAVDVLSDWGRIDKATKYSDHALTYIKQSYKPCHSELSSLNIKNTLKLQFKTPKLESCMISEYCKDEEIEPTHTPVMDFIISSPCPLKWKCFSTFNEEKFLTNKCKTKKLVFDNLSGRKKVNSELEYIHSVGKTNVNNSKCLKDSVVKENEGFSKKDLPSIIITAVNDINHVKTVIKKSPVSPVKPSFSIFSDKKMISLPKRNRKRLIVPSLEQSSASSHNSDEDLGVEFIPDDKDTINVKSVKNTLKPSSPLGINLIKQKLFVADENSDKEINCSDVSCLSQNQDDEKNLVSSSDDNSIIDATVCEESDKSLKLLCSNYSKITTLEAKMSALCMTPVSPLAKPLRTTGKKLKSCLKKNLKNSKEDGLQLNSVGVKKKNLSKNKQSDSTPVPTRTRSSRRLLL